MSLPNEGTYRAALAGQIVIYETDKGATCAAVPVKLTSGDVAWTGKATQTFVSKDGTVNERTLQTMCSIFGDPTDTTTGVYRFGEDAEKPIAEIEAAKTITFDVVIEHKQSSPDEAGDTYAYAAVKYINAAGGGFKMPTAISRKDFLAKHGAKFRALGCGRVKNQPAITPGKVVESKAQPVPAQAELPATPAPAKAKAPVKPKAAPAKPAGGQPVTATQDEVQAVWEAVVAKRSLGEDGAAVLWFEVQKTSVGKEDNELTIQQWGTVKLAFEAELAK